MYNVIGICGRLGSGKDTFASWLINEGIVAYQLSFANRLKRVAHQLFGIKYGSRTIRAREVYQKIGSKMREIDENVWIDALQLDMDKRRVVISDVRYLNEAKWVIDNGILIALICDDDLRRIRISCRDFNGGEVIDEHWKKWNSHASELSTDKIIEKYKNNNRFIIINQTSNKYIVNKNLFFAILKKNHPKLIHKQWVCV